MKEPSSAAASRFSLEILGLTWVDLGYRYTWEEVWPVLQSVPGSAATLVLRDADIDRYDWERQEIQLNGQGSRRLAFAGIDPSMRFAVGQGFRVGIDGERIFGGLFYPHGAAALRFPVIHVVDSSPYRLQIFPELGAQPGWQRMQTASAAAILDARIKTWCDARKR